MKNIIFLFTILTYTTGCSSLTKTSIVGIGSFVGCSLVGSLTAPSDEKPEMHALMWGGVCSSLGMITNETLEKNNEKNNINSLLKKERRGETLDELKLKNSLLESPEIKNMHPHLREKLNGNWILYKTDNWIIDGEKIKHEDMEIEFK